MRDDRQPPRQLMNQEPPSDAPQLTVGELRKAIEGAADDTPVIFHLGDDAFMLKPEDWFFYTRPTEAFCITFLYPDYMAVKERK